MSPDSTNRTTTPTAPSTASPVEISQPSSPSEADHDSCGCGCGHDAAEAQAGPTPTSAPSAQEAGELDVRTLAHGQRHEIIFGRLDQLQPGQALVIVNDHDPKPLRYQTEALWPDRFTWSYLQAGPEVWRVAITRAG